MKEIQKKIFSVFQKEFAEHRENIRNILEKFPQEGESFSLQIDELLRIAHSLKGASRAVDFPFTQQLAEILEKFFLHLKKREVRLSAHHVQVIEKTLTKVGEKLTHPESPDDDEAMAKIMADLKRDLTIPGAEAIDHRLLQVFQAEAREHMENIRLSLRELDVAGGLTSELITGILRELHTLKGAAQAVKLWIFQGFVHEIESTFVFIKSKAVKIKGEEEHLITDFLINLESLIDSPFSEKYIERAREIVALLRKRFGGQMPPRESEPKLRPADKEELAPGPEAQANIKDSGTETDSQPDTLQFLRVDARELDILYKNFYELLAGNMAAQKIFDQIDFLQGDLEDLAQNYFKVKKSTRDFFKKDRRGSEFENFFSLFHYLESNLHDLKKHVRNLRRLRKDYLRQGENHTKEIQKNIQNIRLIPAGEIFRPFKAIVQSLAGAEGKNIDFQIQGQEIRADRLVYEKLKSSVLHIVKNAVVHGIEKPGIRKKMGKKIFGLVMLSLQKRGNMLEISIEDDGQGLDTERIKEEALKNNIISEKLREKIQPEDIKYAILQPGISTSSQITDLYGRGMGMAIVQDTLNHLQGDIEIDFEEKRGTRFKLKVPLNIANLRILKVITAGEVFGIPLNCIEHLFKFHADEIVSLDGKPAIRLDGQYYSVVNLSSFIGLETKVLVTESNKISMLRIRIQGKIFSLIVDEILEEKEVLVKDLPRPLQKNNYFSGAFSDLDGSVRLILNPFAISEFLFQEKSDFFRLRKKAEEKIVRKSTILVVDDSITTRTMEKTILESEGFTVHTAVDGLDALKFLEVEKVDLIISDIDMPRMDGFSLVEAIKGNKALKDIPVIIVTSMESNQDKERGLNLGANAYIVKQKFEQENLIQTIRQIL
jgi:two-component system chemotaxis sensor kinase CheA